MMKIRFTYINGETDEYSGYTKAEVDDFLKRMPEELSFSLSIKEIRYGDSEYTVAGHLLIQESQVRKIEIHN
jgi:hypothetical protein